MCVYTCVYIYFAIQQKLTQHCKSTTLQQFFFNFLKFYWMPIMYKCNLGQGIKEKKNNLPKRGDMHRLRMRPSQELRRSAFSFCHQMRRKHCWISSTFFLDFPCWLFWPRLISTQGNAKVNSSIITTELVLIRSEYPVTSQPKISTVQSPPFLYCFISLTNVPQPDIILRICLLMIYLQNHNMNCIKGKIYLFMLCSQQGPRAFSE